ncbi:eukaryotic translation initiation factor 3 subunit G-domain-containing protein, partial [Piptocephalis cylindrospora]
MAELLSKDKNLNWGAGVDWADEDEIIDYQKPQEYTTPDGLKVSVQYKTNDQGETVKVTKKVRQRLVREKVNHAVAERKKWEKFGAEKGHPPGPDKDTTIVGEAIFLKLILGGRAVQEEPDDDAKLKEQLKGKKILCRICKGGHFTTKCPFKDTLKPLDELEGSPSSGDTSGAAASGAPASAGLQKPSSTGRYVPPSARLAASGEQREGDRMGSRPER